MREVFRRIREVIFELWLKLIRLTDGDAQKIVHRMPQLKVLRPNLYGQSIALVTVLSVVLAAVLGGIPGGSSIDYTALTVMAIIATWWGGVSVLIVTVAMIWVTIFSGVPQVNSTGALYFNTGLWYLSSFAFAHLLAGFYNLLIFGYIRKFRKDLIKITFAFDFDKKFNVVKSPLEYEERALNKHLQSIRYFVRQLGNPVANPQGGSKVPPGKNLTTDEGRKLYHDVRRARKKMTSADRKKLDDFLEEKFQQGNYKDNVDTMHAMSISTDQSERDNVKSFLLTAETILERYLKINEQRLYNFDIDLSVDPRQVYTIVLVANPRVVNSFVTHPDTVEKPWNTLDPSQFRRDPIIYNKRLFLRGIENALFSFENDPVLGHPDIWPFVRIVAVFDEDLADPSYDPKDYALVQPYMNFIAQMIIRGNPSSQQDVKNDLREAAQTDNMINAVWRTHRNYKNMLQKISINQFFEKEFGYPMSEYENPDIIFALSDTLEFDRASANMSDFEGRPLGEQGDGPNKVSAPTNFDGPRFGWKVDPKNKKGNTVAKAPILPASNGKSTHSDLPARKDEDPIYINNNECRPSVPGRAAIHVAGASLSTYIHEFGHAMSSTIHGAIVDEYYDRNHLLKESSDNINVPAGFYINRLERQTDPQSNNPLHSHPIPREFVKYDHKIYLSERNHPTSEEKWRGYFPERFDHQTVCTMDRVIGPHRWDKLLRDYIYDRLLFKINRPEQCLKPNAKNDKLWQDLIDRQKKAHKVQQQDDQMVGEEN